MTGQSDRGYLGRLFGSRTLRNIGITFGSQIGTRALAALAMMLVIRNLSQEEFGGVALVQSIIVVAAGVLLQGVNWAMIRGIGMRRAEVGIGAELIRESFWVTVVITCGIASAIVFVPSLWSIFRGMALLEQYRFYLAFGVVSAALMNFSVAVLQGLERFKLAAFASLIQATVLVIVYYVLAKYQGLTLNVVLSLIALMPLISFAVYMFSSAPGVFGGGLKIQMIGTVFESAKWYVVYSSILAIAGQLDILMMARYFTFKDVATYSVASKLFGILILGLGAIHSVLLPRMSSIVNVAVLRSMLLRSLRLSIPAAGLVVLVTMLFPDEIIRVFAGSGYSEAKIPLQILGFCAAASMILSPSVNVLFAMDRIKVIVFGGTLLLLVGVVGHTIVTSRYGAFGAAWTTFCAYTAINGFFFLTVLYLTRHPVPRLENMHQ